MNYGKEQSFDDIDEVEQPFYSPSRQNAHRNFVSVINKIQNILHFLTAKLEFNDFAKSKLSNRMW